MQRASGERLAGAAPPRPARRRAGPLRPVSAGPAAPRVVALVSDAVYPYHVGGKEVRYHHEAVGLAARGVEVHVFTMRWWPGPASKVEDGVHYHGLCRVRPLYVHGRRSIAEALVFALACVRLLGFRFDLVEADHMPYLPLATIRMVAWARRVPLVVTWHEVWGRAYWQEYLGPLGLVAAAIERAAMHLPDAIVTPSPETGARLVSRRVPSGKVTVVPNGLDLEAIRAAAPAARGFDLLFVGRLIAHKHVDLLLEALAGIEATPPPTCGIVGEGPERAALEAAAGRLGLTGRVAFLGNVDTQREIFELMKASRVFVLPSTREGYGIVVAEAIACGLWAVTTSHEDNAARGLVEEGSTGFLAAPTAAALAAAIEAALAAPPRPAGPPEELEAFSWGRAVASLVEVFGDAGRGRRARRSGGPGDG